MDNKYLVDIIILNFNQESDTAECILSLKRMNYKNYRIILVDNGSTDGSGGRLKERFKYIEFLKSGENIGFAGGANIGIKRSLESGLANYILLLNNDTVVGEELLDSLLEVAEMDNEIGVIGAVNFYYSWPDKVHMAGHRFLWWLGIQGKVFDVGSNFKEVQSVSACCMLIKRKVVEKAGLLDERFFVYYEDSDFCLRARRAGFKVGVARDAKVWHKINRTLGTGTPREYYIYTRNQPLFMLKHCPRLFLPNYFAVYFSKVFIRIIYFFVTLRKDFSVWIYRGLADFIKGNFGKGRLFE